MDPNKNKNIGFNQSSGVFNPNSSESDDQQRQNTQRLKLNSTNNNITIMPYTFQIEGMGNVPGYLQQMPDGSYKMYPIQSDSQLASYIAQQNDHSYFRHQDIPKNLPQIVKPQTFNTSNTNSNFPIQTSVPPLKVIEQRFTNTNNNNFIPPTSCVENIRQNQTSYYPLNSNNQNTQTRVQPREIYYLNEKTLNELGFRLHLENIREVLKCSNTPITEDEILKTGVSQWKTLTPDQKQQYYQKAKMLHDKYVESKSIKQNIQVINNPPEKYTPTSIQHNIIPENVVEKKKSKKCIRPGCSTNMEENLLVDGYYCNDKCAVLHSKKLFQKTFSVNKF